VTGDEFVARVPRVYHMAEDGTWESIADRGLLSASALLDLYGYTGTDREKIESMRRPQSVSIAHPDYGPAVIRDNKPMSDAALDRCLVGMTHREWYELLNSRCFFWCTVERLESMLNAVTYRGQVHTVLTVDTARLLERHADEVELSTINTGSTLYVPPKRGRHTFVSLKEFPAVGKPAELVIPHSVPDIAELVVDVSQRKGRGSE
jgi:hypothetical protein